MNIECLAEHCLLEGGSCAVNQECLSAIGCAAKCMEIWDNDTTIEKVYVQNCTNICAFSYDGKVYETFMTCVSDHQCLSFPPIPSQCKAPGSITLLKKLPAKALKGGWWAVQGHHPVYDCYPCQHLIFEPINDTTWKYTPKYQVYLTDGTLKLIISNYFFPNAIAGSNISFLYHDLGLAHYETWWLIDEADDQSYILMYYCGHTLQWDYDGALVLARQKSLTADDYVKIAASYRKATGLDATKFCYTSTESCPDYN